MSIAAYIPRIADRLLADDLASWPAVIVTGPRAVGKTTTAIRHAASALRLDRPAQRGLALDDPDAAVSIGPFPLLLDEWQHVPEVLGAVKRAVDQDRAEPQRYIITGSARGDLIAGSWPGTGRFLSIELWPLTGRERFGNAEAPSLFDRWETEHRFSVPPQPPGILDYLQIALTGGFPDAVEAPNQRRRERWMRGYVESTASRDLGELAIGSGRRRSPERLTRYLQVLALHSAGVVADAALAEATKLDVRTARGYHDILRTLRLVVDVPAWRTNRLKRLVATPKRYLADSGLAGWLARVDEVAIQHDADARGRILDTYVAAQLRSEAEAAQDAVHLHHLRTHRGEHEIDLIAEFGSRVAAFEVKSGSAPTQKDARHLAWLRDQLPRDRFAGGVVFHTGPQRYGLGQGIEAVPICGLWG
ncbi:ATP-binding protein [Candidatus Poriferisodalis sp.]|uniref:ATP-binding protein n=1 Tax=Candidatus Poriferisodalis sp. TaxID=3101277 RepID=UPI003C6F9195